MRTILTGSDVKENHEKAKGCNIYKDFKRSQNASFLGIEGYEGIPQTFLLNVAAWLVMVVLFIFIRKKVGNYGRVAVMQKEEINWTDMFFEDHDPNIDENSSTYDGAPIVVANAKSSHYFPNKKAILSDTYDIPVPISAFGLASIPEIDVDSQEKVDKIFGEVDEKTIGDGIETSTSEIGQKDTVNGSTSFPKIHVHEIRDRGYLSWIKITFNLTDEQFQEKCGQDSVHYLSFQRHLIVLASIITAFSMSIILPINFHKSYQRGQFSGFADTTIINIDHEYDLLWAHVILANVFLFISVIVMRNFSKRLKFTSEDDSDLSRTVMITGLSKTNCREDHLRTHFKEAYPGTIVTELSFAYNVCKLHDAETKRLGAVSAKLYYSNLLESKKSDRQVSSSTRPKLRPYFCGIWNCRCWGKCKETDAIEYYSEQEQKCADRVELEGERAIKQPLGIAFVTFKRIESAIKVVENSGFIAKTFMHPPVSKYSKRLNSNGWSVKYAPPPQEIYWENLSGNVAIWYVKFVVVNVLMTVFVITFTTPVYLFTTFLGPEMFKGKYHKHENITNIDNTTETVEIEQITVFVSLIVDTLPAIIVCTLGVILVVVVSQSDIIIGFWSRTAGIYSEMVKTFFFLTFMVIALPSLGITSFSYFLDKDHSLAWSCIFYKENGALFVNYLITSSMIGTGAELVRIPELSLFLAKLCIATSKAEIAALRKSILFEFPIGTFYSWIMLEFTILACFCVIYPLVTPFGLLYLCLKYWTDRYNIYFAYAPCKVDKSIHRTAINLVMISMFMLQINLIAYIHFHLGETQNEEVDLKEATSSKIRVLQIFTLITFSLAASLFIGQVCCNMCGDISPIHLHHNEILDFKAHDNDDISEHREKNAIDLDSQSMHENEESKGDDVPVDAVTPSEGGKGDDVIPIDAVTPTEQRDVEAALEIANQHIADRKLYGRYTPQLLRNHLIRLNRNRRSPF